MNWREMLLALRGDGYDVLDWLSAVENPDGTVRITACLVRSDAPREVRLVQAPAPVESVADIFPSAVWHERETAEMFGVTFAGHPDPRRLLLAGDAGAPLRKDVPLPGRLGHWPGEMDPAKPGRRQSPPGTPWQ